MSKALIAYSFDPAIPTLLKLTAVPSELFIVDTWAWEIKVGGSAVATSDQPVWDVDFATEAAGSFVSGTYRVTLVVSDDTPSIDVADLIIFYDKDNATVRTFTGIWDQVIAILNEAMPIKTQEYLTFRDNWQMILAPNLGIPTQHTHDESFWLPEQNTLIAYLVVRDFIRTGANRFLAGLGGGDGAVKRVETGPVNSEWFDGGSIYGNIFKPGGLWEDLLAGICAIAKLVGVHIRGCDEVIPFPPIVLPKSGDYSYMEQYIIAPQFQRR